VRAHLGDQVASDNLSLIDTFLSRREDGDLATDQLLNAIYLTFRRAWPEDKDRLVDAVMRHLTASDT
jgi:hypothetical protein